MEIRIKVPAEVLSTLVQINEHCLLLLLLSWQESKQQLLSCAYSTIGVEAQIIINDGN